MIACPQAGAAAFAPHGGALKDLVDLIGGIGRAEARSSPHIVGLLVRRLVAFAHWPPRGDAARGAES